MSSTFGRVLLFRHLAICVSALMAYLLRQELRVGYAVLAVVAGSAVLNFALYLVRSSRSLEPTARLASPVIGLGAWTALIAVTNGVGSPFVAGLWLEIMLAGMVFLPRAVLIVTAVSALALAGQQLSLGFARGELALLVLEVGFLVGMGSLTWNFNRRSAERERALELEHQRLGDHVGRLELELADERVVGQLGEKTGRLAHRLKNSVHSLRGFTALLEPSIEERGRPALEGLQAAIDDLESLAMLTLESTRPTSPGSSEAGGAAAVIERALKEVRATHPAVRWQVSIGAALPELSISDDDFEEVMLILLRNAIEAMSGRGDGAVEASVRDGSLSVCVRDEGPGLSDEMIEKVFRAGFTTKEGGSGYGLFLARRVVGDHGGVLETEPVASGASFRVTLPPTRGTVPSTNPGSAATVAGNRRPGTGS